MASCILQVCGPKYLELRMKKRKLVRVHQWWFRLWRIKHRIMQKQTDIIVFSGLVVELRCSE